MFLACIMGLSGIPLEASKKSHCSLSPFSPFCSEFSTNSSTVDPVESSAAGECATEDCSNL